MSRPTPRAAEIEEVGRLLVKYWGAKARKALAPYLNETSPWDSALRQVRLLLKDAFTDLERGHKIPISIRLKLDTFAIKYGTETRGVIGSEPLDIKKQLYFGRTQWAEIEAAATAAGVTPAEFIRGAALKAARREEQQ